jgi:phosphatidate cytidylyltransferase
VLKQRLIVAILILPLFTWLIFTPGTAPLFGFFLAGLAIEVFELSQIIRQRGLPFRWPVVLPAVLAMAVVAGFWPATGAWPLAAAAWFWAILLAASLALAVWELFTPSAESSFPGLAIQVFAIVMLGGIASFAFLLRRLPHGSWWVAMLFGFNWLYDAGAYFGGKWFGRRPLAPAISPAKTVEGVIGGLLVNLAAALLVFFTLLPRELGFSAAGFAAWALAQGLLAQAGDLSESLIKRWSGLKDSPGFIPGHGGVLDKFDNAFFTAPILYALACLLLR